MTALATEPNPHLARRERLFIRLRFAALVLLATVASLTPGQDPDNLPVIWSLAAGGALLNCVAWLILRLPRTARAVAVMVSVLDALTLLGFILLSGGSNSVVWLFVFLLIAAVTLRYTATGGVVASVLFALLYVALTVIAGGSAVDVLYPAIVTCIAFASMAFMVSWLIRLESDQALRERDQARQALLHSQLEVSSLAQLSGTMSNSANYQATLRQMLALSLRGLQTREHGDETLAGMILLFDSDEADSLYIAAASGLKEADQKRHITSLGSVIKETLDGGERKVLLNARADPAFSGFETAKAGVSAVVLPLRAALTLFGVAVFFGGSELPGTFDRRRDLIEAYAAQAAIAVQNAKLFEQLRQERDRIVDGEEKTRHELARDLHDGPINQVASLTMGIDFARRLLDREPGRAREELDNMHRLAAKTARDMRMTMYRLRPLALEQSGLTQALEQYLSRLQAEHEQPRFKLVAAKASEFEPRLPLNAAMMVFDIMTEAVGNALKHADAKTVQIQLTVSGDYLIASTSDDGRGFDVAQVSANYAERGSLGLMNIRERADLAQGEAVIESAPGKGSIITVRVPLMPAG